MCIGAQTTSKDFLSPTEFGRDGMQRRRDEAGKVAAEGDRVRGSLGVKAQQSPWGMLTGDNPNATRAADRGTAAEQLAIIRGDAARSAVVGWDQAAKAGDFGGAMKKPTVQAETWNLADQRQRQSFAKEYGNDAVSQYETVSQFRKNNPGTKDPVILTTKYIDNKKGSWDAQDIILDGDGSIYRGAVATGVRAGTSVTPFGPPPAAASKRPVAGSRAAVRSQSRMITAEGGGAAPAQSRVSTAVGASATGQTGDPAAPKQKKLIGL